MYRERKDEVKKVRLGFKWERIFEEGKFYRVTLQGIFIDFVVEIG